jgi:hypothetical protein
MRTDREMTALFAGAVVDEAPDPTFLDELFAVLVEEVSAGGLGVAPRATQGIRFPTRFRPATRRMALLAAGVAIALVGLGLLLRPLAQVGGPSPTPSETSSPSVAPTPVPSQTPATPLATQPVVPSLVLTGFRSSKYQYTISYPKNWKVSSSAGELGSADYPYDFANGVDYFGATSPTVLDPGLIVAGPVVPSGTLLASWSQRIEQLQATTIGCTVPDAREDVTIGGLPGSLLTWNDCPEYLLWAGVVRGTRAYHVVLIDQYATGAPAVQATDKALFLRILASMRFTGATPSPSP